MPSFLAGYEYDVFISYRHNDNLDGWVTDFVQNLEKELRATIKSPLSIYFDKNPDDGLLEMHHVDESLATKLKCVIFIPIVSQTYCDKNSFAWTHEFVAFVKNASETSPGLNVKLSNHNVSSRVLPVQIHDIDLQDRLIFEKTLGSKLRAIDFIYKEPGVNRPLAPGDNEDKNINKTRYKNQINKVANSVKEISAGLDGHTDEQRKTTSVASDGSIEKKSFLKWKYIFTAILILLAAGVGLYLSLLSKPPGELLSKEKSIAVLPFRNDSGDPGNIYFCNGLMEDIISQLSQIPGVRVPSATSMLYYRDNPKPYSEIISELNVAYLLEASVRKMDSRALMNITLIDAQSNQQIWTDRMEIDLSVNDLFDIQYQVAQAVAGKMRITLSDSKEQIPTQDYVAYDQFLKARDLLKAWDISKNKAAIALLRQAVARDPKFQTAWSLLGQTYGQRTELTNSRIWVDSAKYFAMAGYEMNKNSVEALNALAVTTSLGGDMQGGLKMYLEAYKLDPDAPNNFAGWCYYMLGDYGEAAARAAQNIRADPKNYIYYVDMADATRALGLYDHTVRYCQEALKINPTLHLTFDILYEAEMAKGDFEKALQILDQSILASGNVDHIGAKGLVYFRMGDLVKAREFLSDNFEKYFHEETDGDSFLSDFYQLLEYRALIKIRTGQQAEGLRDLESIIVRIKKNLRHPPRKYFLLAQAYSMLGHKEESLANLEMAATHQFNILSQYEKSDLLKPIREEQRYKETLQLIEGRVANMRQKVIANGYLND